MRQFVRWITTAPMRSCTILFVGLGGCVEGGSQSVARQDGIFPQRGYQEEFGHYGLVADWPRPLPDDRHSHEGWTWGSVGAVFAETPDRIWIAMRGELPLPPGAAPWTSYGMLQPSRGNADPNTDGLSATCEPTGELRGWERRWNHTVFVVDGEGRLVDEWPHVDELFSQLPCGRGPHSIKIGPYDPDRHVWIIDDQLHVIYKFTYEGELVMTLGTLGERGRDGGRLFDRPTDIAWLPDGTFFISDGYGGTRVAKFDPDGNFLIDWGSPPADPANPGPGEFRTVHSVAVSADRRVFVVDRDHLRMQVFDEDGNFLDMWPTGIWGRPNSHAILVDPATGAEHIAIADGSGSNRINKYDLEGNFLYGWGGPGGEPGRFNGLHSLTTDQEGNLFIAEVFNGRAQKFSPMVGADPRKLLGQHRRWGD